MVKRGFTLIELLVVIGIIALLLGILVPQLGRARALARAVKCGAQMKSVSAGVAVYLTEFNAVYPLSYWYPNDKLGDYSLTDTSTDPLGQDPAHPNGYAHWSYYLFGYTKDQRAFTCPEFERGGLSRTNPGPNSGYWTAGQTDQTSASSASSGALEDLQAPFIAFTANAAIMPRNKFTAAIASADGGNGQRLNKFTQQAAITNQSATILMTEFNNNWKTVTANDIDGTATRIKSHRPLNPFVGAGGGSDEYQWPLNAQLTRPTIADIYDQPGLQSHVAAGDSLIADSLTQLNAVGRHHPSNYTRQGKDYGGAANFLYVDGHVEKKNVAQTVVGGGGSWEWGETYYTLTGNTKVR
jgi:prepilin-type N-terminal cleavage/methylation domain-containing protein/prepilin-type processing-associated H-X9-DG protein